MKKRRMKYTTFVFFKFFVLFIYKERERERERETRVGKLFYYSVVNVKALETVQQQSQNLRRRHE